MSRPFPLIRRIQELNLPFLGLVAAMFGVGVAMMASAGGGDFREYALPHLMRAVLALGLMTAVALTPMDVFYRYAYWIYFIGVLTLVAVDIIGHIGMGAQRWIKVGSINLQPSEFMKLAVILALARYFHTLHLEDVRRFVFLIVPVILLIVPAVLILRQPNLGTTVITLGVGGILCFAAGVQLRYFIGIAAAGIVSMPIAWQFLHDYQKRRVLTFLDPSQDPLGSGYNILQSMIAIGSGGLFGKGFLQGSQGQLNFLPEKHTDFIFTMFAEEWGFAGSITLLAMFLILLAFGIATAIASRNHFGSLIAVGVTALIFIHLFINTAMVMGMIPVVGVPLPFLSYGGSITLSTGLAMGMLLNAYIHRNYTLLPSQRAFL